MNYYLLMKDIDRCIDELEDLKRTVEEDADRFEICKDRQGNRKVVTYDRIDGSKGKITRARRYVHEKLIRNERSEQGFSYDNYGSMIRTERKLRGEKRIGNESE